jgi:hypothetical protein
LVEHRSEKPGVVSSILTLGTFFYEALSAIVFDYSPHGFPFPVCSIFPLPQSLKGRPTGDFARKNSNGLCHFPQEKWAPHRFNNRPPTKKTL